MTMLILINTGGRHIKVVRDIVAENKEVELYAVVDHSQDHTIEKDHVIYANTGFLRGLKIRDYKYSITIGSNSAGKEIYELMNIPTRQHIPLIHPSAIISESASIGYGTVIMPNAVVNADAKIGNHCIINTNATVEHDSVIEDYVHISPGVTTAGGVSIGKGTHIGTGAIMIPDIKIGDWSTIGAGAVVIKDIGSGVTAVDVPAKVI